MSNYHDKLLSIRLTTISLKAQINDLKNEYKRDKLEETIEFLKEE